jgi:type II secretory pathway component PulM
MLPDYDFSRAVRGRHAEAYAKGINVVRLDDDVAAAFPTAAQVNEALRRSLGEVTVSTKVFRVIERPSSERIVEGSYTVLRSKKLLVRIHRTKTQARLAAGEDLADAAEVQKQWIYRCAV